MLMLENGIEATMGRNKRGRKWKNMKDYSNWVPLVERNMQEFKKQLNPVTRVGLVL